MDKILIRNLKIFAYHGVNEEEKINGQNFVFDIDLYVDYSRACYSDDLNDTVSYAKVIKTVRRIFTEEKYDLLEKAAQITCDAIFDEYKAVERIRLTLKKPEAPIDADFDYVGVEVFRQRQKESI